MRVERAINGMKDTPSSLVDYRLEDSIATIAMDDKKSNVVSPQMINELHSALDQAEKNHALVLLTGREDIFCAGFDLKILSNGGAHALTMVCGGFEIAERLLSFPTPVVIACNGHAIAMGAFLLLSGDYRIGANGPFRIVTNEVEIGLTMPSAGVEICRQRLVPNHFVRAALLAEPYTPETAMSAGFLDCLVPGEQFHQVTQETAAQFAKLNMKAHYQTKMRARRHMLRKLKWSMMTDKAGFMIQGVQGYLKKFGFSNKVQIER